MSNKKVKIPISVAAVMTLLIPFLADFNSTHIFNPLWAPHARFHGMNFLLVNIASGAISLWLLWGKYRERDSRLAIRVAALLPTLCWGSFFPALLVPGVSIFPDGMEPFAPINPNVIIAAIAVILCIVGVVFDRRIRAETSS
jgi:hypothetical protein